jgi:hypothetical protein
MKVLNLDALVPSDKIVTINEKDYRIPGSIPLKHALELSAMLNKVQNDKNDTESMGRVINTLYDIFSIKNKIDKDKFFNAMTISHFQALMEFMFMDKEQIGTMDEKKN